MISHEYPPVGGGGANVCMHLSREFAAKGHEIHVVTVWYSGEKEYERIQVKKNGYIILHRLNTRRKCVGYCSFLEMLYYLIKAMPYVKKKEKEIQFDICVVFFGIPSGPIGLMLKQRFGVPYIIRFGGGDIPGFQKRFSFLYKLISPMIKVIWKQADCLVANSSGLREFALTFYNGKTVEVIPNGVDLQAFSKENRMPVKTMENEFRLLFVSRLIERKGLQDFLPQLFEIKKECEKKGYCLKLFVVGDGPYRDTLESIVKNECVEDIVEFCGQKDKRELPEYYSNADLFIFPSHKEGMPNVVLEAMSYGLPIVMTACEGSMELIDGNGYAVPVIEFAEKIIALCGNGKCRQMGAKSKELVSERFTWKNMAESYLDLLNDIMEKRP